MINSMVSYSNKSNQSEQTCIMFNSLHREVVIFLAIPVMFVPTFAPTTTGGGACSVTILILYSVIWTHLFTIASHDQ